MCCPTRCHVQGNVWLWANHFWAAPKNQPRQRQVRSNPNATACYLILDGNIVVARLRLIPVEYFVNPLISDERFHEMDLFPSNLDRFIHCPRASGRLAADVQLTDHAGGRGDVESLAKLRRRRGGCPAAASL